MNNSENKKKAFFLGYLMLTFYYAGGLAMLLAITYPPFQVVHENFRQHAMVLEHYLLWALYIPGIFMLLASLALIFFRPSGLYKLAVDGSVFLSLISVAAMFFCMLPLHHQWTTTGFDALIFQETKNKLIIFQLIPSIIQALLAAGMMYGYLNGVQRTTRLLFIALFVLCFFPMGTIIIECHVNYALWATVISREWTAYRQLLIMPTFLAIFLIPFYFPIVVLVVIACKKRQGLSRRLVFIALLALLYVFVISAAYFVPDIQFELDNYHSQTLLQELIRNEILLRTPAEFVYWAMVALMFWNFRPQHALTHSE